MGGADSLRAPRLSTLPNGSNLGESRLFLDPSDRFLETDDLFLFLLIGEWLSGLSKSSGASAVSDKLDPLWCDDGDGGDWSGGKGLQVSVIEQLVDEALLLPRATSPDDEALLLPRSSPDELDPLELGRRPLKGDMTGDLVPVTGDLVPVTEDLVPVTEDLVPAGEAGGRYRAGVSAVPPGDLPF